MPIILPGQNRQVGQAGALYASPSADVGNTQTPAAAPEKIGAGTIAFLFAFYGLAAFGVVEAVGQLQTK